MTRVRRNGIRIGVALAVLSSVAASAYVLPGYSILRRLADARDDLKLSNFKVEGALSFHGAAAKEASAATGVPLERAELPLDGVFFMRPPLRCRFEARTVDTVKSAAVVNAGKKRNEGAEIPTLTVALEQLCATLAGRSQSDGELRAKLEAHLKSVGVETTVTSLSRFGGDVAYVLGAKEEGKPQFWIYKDEPRRGGDRDGFVPGRLRYTDKAGVSWDLRLYDYSSSVTEEWFPRTVELFRNNELQLRFTALSSDAKTAHSDKLF